MTVTPKEIERLVDRKHIVHYGLLDVEAASVRHNAEVTIEPASKLRITPAVRSCGVYINQSPHCPNDSVADIYAVTLDDISTELQALVGLLHIVLLMIGCQFIFERHLLSLSECLLQGFLTGCASHSVVNEHHMLHALHICYCLVYFRAIQVGHQLRWEIPDWQTVTFLDME